MFLGENGGFSSVHLSASSAIRHAFRVMFSLTPSHPIVATFRTSADRTGYGAAAGHPGSDARACFSGGAARLRSINHCRPPHRIRRSKPIQRRVTSRNTGIHANPQPLAGLDAGGDRRLPV
jgi:hypothetical protein